MPKRLKPLKLTECQKLTLEHITRCSKTPKSKLERAKIILSSSEVKTNIQIARELNINRETVKKWRNRWLTSYQNLCKIEEDLDDKELKDVMLKILSDDERPGAPPEFTSEQIVQIVALACELPNRPISNWSSRELADE